MPISRSKLGNLIVCGIYSEHSVTSMDQILSGLIKSNHNEKLKVNIIKKKIAPAGAQKHSEGEVMKVLAVCWDAILQGMTTFETEDCKEVYVSWAKNNPQAFYTFFDENKIDALFNGTYISTPINIIWIAHQSAILIRETSTFQYFTGIFHSKFSEILASENNLDLLANICRMMIDLPELALCKGKNVIFCIYIVKSVSKVTLPDINDPAILRSFASKVTNDIGRLMKIIWKADSNSLYVSLQTIFRFLCQENENDDSSFAHAGLISNVPTNYIEKSSEYICKFDGSDTALFKVLEKIIEWLRWPITKNIDRLISSVLVTLERSSRHLVLLECIAIKAKFVLSLIKDPNTRTSSCKVLEHMLLRYVQPLPTVFHSLLDDFIILIEKLNKNGDKETLRNVANIIYGLMHIYSGFPDLYLPISDTLKSLGISKPNDLILQSYKDNCKALLTDDIREGIISSSNTNDSRRGTLRKIGLINEGNTCYINCVIQALYMCKINNVLSAHISVEESEFRELQNLFAILTFARKSVVSALDFINASVPPWVRDSKGKALLTQQDCYEYLSYLLDQLDEKSATKDKVIDRLFTGEMSFFMKCLNCLNVSVTKQPFKVLNLSFPKCNELEDLSLETLFSHWRAPENLSGECQYECDVCNSKQDAERSQKITKVGEYLILTLGRYRSIGGNSEKIRTNVTYPYIIPSPSNNGDKYHLNAVIFHHGYSLSHGHYYTYARESDQWILFNDAVVRETDFDCLKTVTKRIREESAYVLVYVLEGSINDEEMNEATYNRLYSKFKHIIMKAEESTEKEQNNGRFYKSKRWDKDDRNPPGSCGGGGGGEWNIGESNRFVF
ncbi:DgyrCDS4434 [Dimorphilus gyrociliatus]|uniref:Ubiquitin carboxyl-terminal hydrolase n=1 Tax=Dimorphilus gyrociliatus TaxID=2664684 RepID=A0A7I8VJ83_9ANNE|nr:DgyrCDS4434 [Dimorphilus gyrociliatus]